MACQCSVALVGNFLIPYSFFFEKGLSPTLLVLPIRPGLNGPIPIGGAAGLLRNARAQRLRPTKDPLSVSEDNSSHQVAAAAAAPSP